LRTMKISRRFWGSVHVVLSTSNIRVLTGGKIDHEIYIDSSNPEMPWGKNPTRPASPAQRAKVYGSGWGVSAMTEV
jgi:hypothetical protein